MITCSEIKTKRKHNTDILYVNREDFLNIAHRYRLKEGGGGSGRHFTSSMKFSNMIYKNMICYKMIPIFHKFTNL